MNPTLLILAAGMGSRYGGLKQADRIGPSGETIIDYSIYDAIRAGFGKVVMVVRQNILDEMKSLFDNRWGEKINIEYAIQEVNVPVAGIDNLPEREKPWGTAHAVMVAKNNIIGGFPLRLDTNKSIADTVQMMAFYDLPMDYLDTFKSNVDKTTEADVKQAFKRRINPENFVTISVGNG